MLFFSDGAELIDEYTVGDGSGNTISLPTNTTATNSTTTWKPAGKFANTSFAVNKVAHAGGYYYLLQKDGDYAKVVRYQDAVDGNGNYIQDSTFTPYDLTDSGGAKLNVNHSNGGQYLDGFDVDDGGTVYAWTSTDTPAYVLAKYGNIDMVYAYQKGAYAWSKSWTLDQGSANGPLGDEVLGLHAWPGSGVAVLTYTMKSGNTNTPTTIYRYDSSGNQAVSSTPASYDGFQNNYNGVDGLLFHQTLSPNLFGMNSSGSVGIVAPANVINTSTTYFATAASIDSNFDSSSEARANFPALATGTTLFGVIPTSYGDIVATRTSSGAVNVDEYNNYTGTDVTNASGKFDVWPTSFSNNIASTGSSTLGGTETNPIVYSYGTDGQSIYVEGLQGSDVVKNGTVNKPAAPQNVKATPGEGQISLAWDASPQATSYTVQYGTDPDNLTQAQTVASGTSAVFTGLTDGTTYYFTVTAVNSVGRSVPSVAVSAAPTSLSAPTDVTADVGVGQVSLKWTAVPNVTGYKVFYGTSSGQYTKTLDVTGTSATITGLTPGTTYYFAVSDQKDANSSANSAEVTATPAPAVPAGLSATAADGQVNLTWNAVDGADKYEVYDGTKSGTYGLQPVATVTSASATVTGLNNGTMYYFIVKAAAGSAVSNISNEASALPVGGTVNPPLTDIDSPADGALVDGKITVSGWALNHAGVSRVDAYAYDASGKSIFLGSVNAGKFSERGDVAQAFADQNYALAKDSGYSLSVDTKTLKAGSYMLAVAGIGRDGSVKWATCKITVKGMPLTDIDTPANGASMTGTVNVRGWALNHAGIERVDVYVFDSNNKPIFIGTESGADLVDRGDVDAAFQNGGYANLGKNGYQISFDTTKLPAGQYTLAVAGIGTDGDVKWETRTIRVGVLPLTDIDTPANGASVTGTVNVRGWALNHAGIERVDAYVFGSNNKPTFIGTESGTNLADRGDVDAAFKGAGYANLGKNGYQISFDTTKLPAGQYTLAVAGIGTDGDVKWETKSITVIPQPLTDIDAPANGASVTGTVNVRGWALNHSGIDRIDAYVFDSDNKPIFIGTESGADLADRGDVDTVFKDAGYTNLGKNGYQISFDTTKLLAGQYTLAVAGIGTDRDVKWETRTIQITN